MKTEDKTLVIGTIFTYNGKTYQVVKSDVCMDCTFRDRVCSLLKSYTGPCTSSIRSDKTNVILKEINNMEIKNNQLTIDIPEGMEIDTKNSDLVNGIIKFKKKQLTYNTIFHALGITTFSCNSVSNEYISKLEALAKLINIAKYYNGDWKPN